MFAGSLLEEPKTCSTATYFCTTLCCNRCCRPHHNLIVRNTVMGDRQLWEGRIILGQIPLSSSYCCCAHDDLAAITASFNGIHVGLVIQAINEFERKGLCGYKPVMHHEWGMHTGRTMSITDHASVGAPKDTFGSINSGAYNYMPLFEEPILVPESLATAIDSSAPLFHHTRGILDIIQHPMPDNQSGGNVGIVGSPEYTAMCHTIQAMHETIMAHEGVYLHCKAGVGRSALILLCYLCTYGGYTPEAAQAIVEYSRPTVDITPARLENVRAFAEAWKGSRTIPSQAEMK